MSSQPALFDEPEHPAVPAPKRARPGLRAVAPLVEYFTSGVPKAADCAHCALVVYQALRDEGTPGLGHSIRRARVRRVEGKLTEMLCNEHAQQSREHEASLDPRRNHHA